LLTDRLLSRSPQIRALTFTTQLHHLRWPLVHVVSSSGANLPSAYASYDVLVHQLVASLKDPTVGASGFLRTTPHGNAHAGLWEKACG